MTTRPTEIVFMPGFDGVAELRADFVRELGAIAPARAIGYPNRSLESLTGYARFAASQVGPESRPVVIAESFSGLVAARWASQDPHVAALVLCGAFARNPSPVSQLAASWPATAQFLGANFMAPIGFFTPDPARRRWSQALTTAVSSLPKEILAERMRIIAAEDVSAELGGLRIPVILVQFQEDLVIDPSARAALEAACHEPRVVAIRGPHFAIETRPVETAAALRPHLEPLFA
jgi:pimeloyl-ACP methyl ester carboxylesterase